MLFNFLQLQVTWYKNTMKLQDGEKIHTKHIGNTHKLVIANVAEEDQPQAMVNFDEQNKDDLAVAINNARDVKLPFN